jgi:hypothetical protein
MELVSRGDARQMVRAVRSGATWEQVRQSYPGIDPSLLDSTLRDFVLKAAGVQAAPVADSSPVPPKTRRKKG